MNWSVSEVTQPSVEPVSVAEAKDHLRVDTSDDDDLIGAYIASAREWAEAFMGYAIIQRQLKLTLDQFPGSGIITLPRSNLISIDSVEYVDRDETTQTWAASNYSADTSSEEGRLIRGFGVDWPNTLNHPQSVTITYTAGYPDDGASPPDYTANVPESVKAAIKLLVGHLYENREAVVVGTIVAEVPFAVKALLSPHQRMYL